MIIVSNKSKTKFSLTVCFNKYKTKFSIIICCNKYKTKFSLSFYSSGQNQLEKHPCRGSYRTVYNFYNVLF